MKHFSQVSKPNPVAGSMPRPANVFQDIFCDVNEVFQNLLALKGGTSPIKEFIAEECTPIPPGDGEN